MTEPTPPDGGTPPANTQTPSQPPAGSPPGQTVERPVPPTAPRLPVDAEAEQITRLFHNLSGQLTAYVAQAERYQGQLEQRLRTLETAARLNNERAQQLQTERDQLSGQIAAMGDVQQRASERDSLQAQLDRLTILTRYPQIMNLTEIIETPGEEGQPPRQERRNAAVDLLMATTLTGDEFQTQIEAFVRQLPAPQAATQPGPPPAAGSTRPPSASPPSTADTLRAQWMEALAEGDYTRAEQLIDQYQQATYANT